MIEQCLLAIEELENNPIVYSLLTERAKELLAICKNKLHETEIQKSELLTC